MALISPREHAAIMAEHGRECAYQVVVSRLQQAGAPIHIGARSSWQMRGTGQYIEMGLPALRMVFGPPGTAAPPPLDGHDWGIELPYFPADVLPPDLGMLEWPGGIDGAWPLRASGDGRAMLEALAVSPGWQELQEAYEVMENLCWLDASEVQPLLEACTDTKAKRAFLYLAECAENDWVGELDMSRIDLGDGVVVLEDKPVDMRLHGVLINKHQLIVPDGLGMFGRGGAYGRYH